MPCIHKHSEENIKKWERDHANTRLNVIFLENERNEEKFEILIQRQKK
jgi:hypothetical protein